MKIGDHAQPEGIKCLPMALLSERWAEGVTGGQLKTLKATDTMMDT